MSQAQTIQFNTTQANIESLRCSVCRGYLSCAPICLLPDGSNICSRCSPFNEEATYRQLTLEAILRNAIFPCIFTEHGCAARLLFGNTVDHETKCEHRPVTCFSCLWKGLVMQLPEHFAKQHPNLLKQDAEFIIQVKKNMKGILMVVKNGTVFTVKYLYDASKINLKYDIRCFGNVGEFCKIKLTNYLEPDYVSQCKGSKCISYNQDFHNMLNSTDLNINNFLKNLNDPKTIKVTFDLNTSISTKHLVVNYDILETNKCNKCQYYLIPPIYDYKDEVVCFACSRTDNCWKPSKDVYLNNILAVQNFPCRWRSCDFIGKAEAIHPHELQCEFRTYRCINSECKATVNRTTLIQHLRDHKYLYFVDEFVYKINIENSPDKNCMFTIINNEIVTIEYSTYSYHCLCLQICTNPEQFAASVYFEHLHCKCKSKKFSFGKDELRVYFKHLPSCFKREDELTVTLKIE